MTETTPFIKHLALAIFMLLVSGCSSVPRNIYAEQLSFSQRPQIAKFLYVTTIGGRELSAIRVGSKQPPFDVARREEFGKRLAERLSKFGYFGAAEFVKEGASIENTNYVLTLDFVETYVGTDGWPFHITLTATLTDKNGKVILNETYSESINLLKALVSADCADCFSTTIAEKTITQKLFRDLDEI